MGSVTNLVKTLTNPSNFVSRDHFLSSSQPVYLRTSSTEHPEVATRKPSYDLIGSFSNEDGDGGDEGLQKSIYILPLNVAAV